jgi:hypothetical protein
MQNEKTLEQMIHEYEAQMPPEIMDLLKSFDWKREVRMIVNQNQLMLDVGVDLEQSVYLMLLGAVKVDDLYERLTETHEMPDDKAKKIIEEAEAQIFKPLHQKLLALDAADEQKERETKPKSSVPPMIVMGGPSRDAILAEIEKEPEVIAVNKSIQQPETKPANVPMQNPGIVEPFSLSQTKEIKIEEPALAMGQVAQGVQAEPVSTGLVQPTVMRAPIEQPPVKSYVADPYREPIE